ncbi:MAG: hypothetical protein ABIJ23_04110 [Candidatus Magasanikbacteria bacterium]
MVIMGVSNYAIFENQASNFKHDHDLSLHIAEAGVNYYRWHLAHNATDYWDGTGGEPGPYIHEYNDKDGNLIGYYSLEIDEPPPGSSVVILRSTGWTISRPQSTRTIQVRLGFPSLTDYTFLSNAGMNFSFTTEVHGAVHSNGEIRFDGETDSWVDSAIRVYGGGGPKSFWRYPVPAIDFFSITGDMANIRDLADDGGIHLTSSGEEGWHLVFTGDNFDLYKVNTRDCYYGQGKWKNKGWSGWYWDGTIYCYDIGTETFIDNYDIPGNGAIFIEDETWIEGVVDGRVSVAVGRFPVQEPYKKVFINNNLTYNEKSSDDVLGVMAQGNIHVPYEVPDTMEIDSALLSQFGQISRPYYYDDLKDSLSIFGSQISYEGGGWKWVNGWGHVISGFVDTYHSYDGNLRYNPPPGFPVETNYELISWEEL